MVSEHSSELEVTPHSIDEAIKMDADHRDSVIKDLSGFALAVLPHATCLMTGAYKGAMNASGEKFEIPFSYLWAWNIIATSGGKALIKKETDSALGKAANGAFTGAVAAPLEFMVGYGIGYAGSWLINRVGHAIINQVFY